MKRPKALLVRPDGRTFVRAACDALERAGLSPLLCVVAFHRAAIEAELRSRGGVHAVVNPDPQRGQVSSLSLGLRAAAQHGAAFGLVVLVDMPPPLESTVRALAAAAEADPGAMIVPTYRGQRGHPVAFPVSLAEPLSRPKAGEGARHVISRLGLTTRELPVDDPAVLVDLDTPEELAKWRARAGA